MKLILLDIFWGKIVPLIVTTGDYKNWRKRSEENNMADTQITILGMSGAERHVTC